jgi:hypothetical protein
MTSQINFSAIDTGYPVAGQDNDSQGFRDNFGAIATGLQTAKSEITNLQNRAVLKSNLDDNSAVTNNLNGSTISNGKLNQMAQVAIAGVDTAGVILCNASTAAFYYATVTENITVQFTGWPEWETAQAPALSKVQVMLKAGAGDTVNKIITFAAGSNTLKLDTASTSGSWASGAANITLNATTKKWKLVEAFTWDGGLNVYVRFLGEY